MKTEIKTIIKLSIKGVKLELTVDELYQLRNEIERITQRPHFTYPYFTYPYITCGSTATIALNTNGAANDCTTLNASADITI